MLSYIVRRLFLMIPTILAISAIVFVIIQLPPGDYFTSVVNEIQSRGESVDRAKLEFLKSQYGFDKPLYVQYFHWVGGMLGGDFGYSFEHDQPVTDVVGDRLLLTFIVSFTTIIFTWAIAFPIGVYSAVKQYSVGDYGLTFIGFIGLATPNFLLALILQYFAHIWFDVSIGGLMDPIYVDQPWTWEKSLSVMQHIWIPVLVIGTAGTASMIRRLRANLLDELSKQYVITARAKGLPPLRALLKYPLRSALLGPLQE